MAKAAINILDMHCASCVIPIEKALKKTTGVLSVSINFASDKAFIEYDSEKITLGQLHKIINDVGFKTLRQERIAGGWELVDIEKQIREQEIRSLKIKFTVSIVLSSPLIYFAMAPSFGIYFSEFVMKNMALIELMLATPVIVAGGQFFKQGIKAVIKTKSANMDTLVALGVGAAYLYSLYVSIAIWLGKASLFTHNLYYEISAFLITFILLGKLLEAIAKGKTSEAIRKLMGLSPKRAVVLRNGAEKEIPIEEVLVQDIVLVKPGQKIPVDGIVIEGYSSVDESMISGESIPAEKFPGQEVIGGTINKTGSFKFKATKVGKDTALAQIVKLVQEAQGSKAPIQELADKISAYFVPAVLLIGILSFVTWILVGQSFIFALTTLITVLIIACPCALGLATPTAVMVGTGIGAQNGILIKSASSLQTAHQIKTIVFDKTGTITKAKPHVTDIISYNRNQGEVLMLAASVEKNSEHPLGEAIVNLAKEKDVVLREVKEFDSMPGEGLWGRIGNEEIILGNLRLMSRRNISVLQAEKDLGSLESDGKAVVFIASNSNLIGIIALADTLKESSQEAVYALKKLGKNIIMITGDNLRTAQAIARKIGINKILSEVLPQDKAKEIKRLQSQGLKVAMVGDGINDAPALMQADLGIAIGSGTDVAIESGDIVLIKDDLRDVVMAIDLSRYAIKKIKQNLFWAFFYNLIGIPIAAGALYPFTGFLLNPMIAGIAMAFSSVSVVTNSLSMKKYRRPI